MSLSKLLAWRDIAGTVYGMEDQAMFLYSLIKMHRPTRVLELGTGVGMSTFWMAQALRENGHGHLVSVDNGAHWNHAEFRSSERFLSLRAQCRAHELFAGTFADELPEYFDWLESLSELFELKDHITFLNETLDLTRLASKADVSFMAHPATHGVDLLYADFSHGPIAVLALLGHFLPRMSHSASIFIDSAATAWASYLVLEQTIAQLNAGKIPAAFLVGADQARRAALLDLAATRRFSFIPLTERKDRSQNGLGWIRIEPVNVFPYPLTAMRGGGERLATGAGLAQLLGE